MVRALFGLLILSACRTPEPTPIAVAPEPERRATAESPTAPSPARPQAQRQVADDNVPTLAAEPDPKNWKHNGGMTSSQGDAMCAKELPRCKHPFGSYTMPPSPCAHQGTLCTYHPSPTAGTWSCGCEACSSNEDCAPNEHCGTNASPCSYARVAMRCLPGPQTVAQPCMEPAVP